MDDDAATPIDPDLDPSDPSEPTTHPERRPIPRRHRTRTQPDVRTASALGGMLGASARYRIALWLPVHPDGFPWATF